VYLWLKAFHVASVVTWIGGMLVLSLILSALSTNAFSRSNDVSVMMDAVRKWDRNVTAPAMLLTWGLGLAMAIQAGWFDARWLTLKLVLVVALSALHGIQSGLIRRLFWNPSFEAPRLMRASGTMTLVVLVFVAILVVIKPL
jgi:protoporphyrinogen IX oxidase